MEITIHNEILSYAFIMAVIMGAVVNKTNFCTLGAVSDWINMGDTGRLRSWLLAIAIAIGGLTLLESIAIVDLDSLELKDLRPPYRMANFEWLRFILGGLMFGIGMTLASGCVNKTLIRVGGGNLKSLTVLIVASLFAYLMAKTEFYGNYFYSWMSPFAIDLSIHGIEGQDVGHLVADSLVTDSSTTVDAIDLRTVFGSFIFVFLMAFIWKSKEFRENINNILGGTVVGLCVVAGWWVTGGAKGQNWLEAAMFTDTPPRGIGAQSFTFTSPMADTFDYALHITNHNYITFGVMTLTGVILGSFLYAIYTRTFRFEWFRSWKDMLAHFIGAVLMGIGGVLALGCTIGQGITGISTLAVGSFLALISIVVASAVTMKVQYNLMM